NLLIEVYRKTSLSLVKVHVKNKLNLKMRLGKRSPYKTVITNFLAENHFTIDELKYVPFAFWFYRDLLIKRDFKDHKKAQDEAQKIYENIASGILSKLKTSKKILKHTEDVVSELL